MSDFETGSEARREIGRTDTRDSGPTAACWSRAELQGEGKPAG
jgi:hypothetical protein